jgi:hypothetical protein
LKILLLLFVIHLAVCGTVGDIFRERTETHRDSDLPVETTAAEERARGETSLLIAQTRITVRFPSAVMLYALGGLLALAAGFLLDLLGRLDS